jgi:hypothetical protein
VDAKPRPGVVVWVETGELDVIPGLSDPPEHEDYFLLENPTGRAGLDHETYFDMRDVNVVTPDAVEVVGIFPRPQWDDLLERLALLGVVEPDEK